VYWKSVCIERITAKLDAYYPVPGQFFFGDYKASDVVVFEEFSWEKFRSNYPQLKRLLEGKDFAVDQKSNESRKGCIIHPLTIMYKGVLYIRREVTEENEINLNRDV
jgi:hypothetical protein